MSEKINDLIKTDIPRATCFSEVFTKLMRLADKINEQQPELTIETYPFETVCTLPEVKQLRENLNKYVFQRLMR